MIAVSWETEVLKMTLRELKDIINSQPDFALDDEVKVRFYPKQYKYFLQNCHDPEDYHEETVTDIDQSYGQAEFVIEI